MLNSLKTSVKQAAAFAASSRLYRPAVPIRPFSALASGASLHKRLSLSAARIEPSPSAFVVFSCGSNQRVRVRYYSQPATAPLASQSPSSSPNQSPLPSTLRTAPSSVPTVAPDQLIAGIDEAGRGAVMGPLVIAAVALSKETEAILQSAGVRDSKYLTKAARERLAMMIRAHAEDYAVVQIPATEIDARRGKGESLNAIEMSATFDLMHTLQERRGGPLKAVVVDAFESDAEKFATPLQLKFSPRGTRVVAEHKADSKYVVVAAASIIAKTERDAAMSRIQSEVGDSVPLGSGYPADRVTRSAVATIQAASQQPRAEPEFADPYLSIMFQEQAAASTFIRQSWKTNALIAQQQQQQGTTMDNISLPPTPPPAATARPRSRSVSARPSTPLNEEEGQILRTSSLVRGTMSISSAAIDAALAKKPVGRPPNSAKRSPATPTAAAPTSTSAPTSLESASVPETGSPSAAALTESVPTSPLALEKRRTKKAPPQVAWEIITQ